MKYFFQRLVYVFPVSFGVLTLTFLLIHLVPGNPIDLMLGDRATEIDRSILEESLGLNKPIIDQYFVFLKNFSKGNLGRSLYNDRWVSEEIFERLPATFELTLASLFWAILLGIPLGIFAALKQYSFVDNSISVIGLIGLSIPGFWLGPILILIFSIHFDLLPVSERGGIEHLILPSITLGLPLSAILMRMTRSSMLEVIKEDFIRTAKAKGLSFFSVYFKHALKNALMPIITIIGLQFGALLTGTVITETIYDWPGVGTLFYQAIQQRNYPLVQGCVLFISFTYVFVNLLTDLTYALVNPKVKLS